MVGVQSHFVVKPNLVLRLGWGFDNKMSAAEIIGVGESDHLGVMASKKTRELWNRKRIYKNFDKNKFSKGVEKAR